MKRKININRPEISSEEIAKRKNFDSVLKHSASVGGKPLFKKPWFLSGVIAVTIAVVTTVVLLDQNKKGKQSSVSENKTQLSNSDSLALLAFYKEQESKPCINPPLKEINVPYSVFKFAAAKGAQLEIGSGSKLTIPKNAFVDEKGKILKGEIELRYREFHDAADFFVSGIPMTYDSAGVKYQFESAGMIEILAYQNGKAVNMAPEKSINVELASNYKGKEYNLYKLDTMANNWSCLGKDKVVVEALKPVDPIKVFDKKEIEKTPEYLTIENKKIEIKKEKEVEMAALPKPIAEPKKPEQGKKGKYVLGFEPNINDFPELAVYKNISWQIGDENENFNDETYSDIDRTIWESSSIKEGNKPGENYNLTIKKGSKKYNLVVYPVYEGKNYEKAIATFQEKFNKYKTTLDKRLAEEARVEEAFQIKMAKYEAEQKELIRKREEQIANYYNSMDNNEKVLRMFAVNSFGVYNSDCAKTYPKGVLCTANIKNEKKNNLRCYDVYLVDKQRNGLFTYSRNPLTNFSFDPTSKNMLWTVEDGVLYWLKPEQFGSISGSDGAKDLIMNRVDQKFSSVEELKAYFNF
ncbi:MAG: hypothetical protein NTX97_15495 [Bacteroidetes bacterium]|nr:hypothetical protein [Bacteroidota bacterium]